MKSKKLIGRPKGIPHSEETKRKISAKIKAIWARQKGKLAEEKV